jgi:polyisoprenoid-binding protein YceI
VTATSGTSMPAVRERPRRKRHWLRWILVGFVAFIVLVVVAIVVSVKLEKVPAPLTLPASAAPPSGPLDGTWRVASGSVAGFRIRQTVLGATSFVVGRTEDVTGTVTVANGQITAASLRVNLLALKSGGKAAPQFQNALETQKYPDANVSLDQPVALGATFASGAPISSTAAGHLTLHGTTRAVSVPLLARRNAADLDVSGSIPVTFADWGFPKPQGFGFFGSLADHGTAEFLLVLHHS